MTRLRKASAPEKSNALGTTVTGNVTVTVGSNPNGGGQGTNSPLPTLLPVGDIGISFQGIQGRSYQIQRSTNLSSWTTLDTDSRPAMLSTFDGLAASGMWTLFVADQSAGEISTLQSWSLTIQGVPGPSAALLAIMGTLPLFRRRRPTS